MDHIDTDGYRANVGMIVANVNGLVLLGGRFNQSGWQFPQGGIRVHETPEQAMYRELAEEIGLSRDDVELMGETRDWLRYQLPNRYIRKHTDPVCIGQKQRWFMLRLIACYASIQWTNPSLIAGDGLSIGDRLRRSYILSVRSMCGHFWNSVHCCFPMAFQSNRTGGQRNGCQPRIADGAVLV